MDHMKCTPIKFGDVAYELSIYPGYQIQMILWEGDDEFPPNLKFMFDENILDYMHFETVFFMMSHILKRMETIADQYDRDVSES